MKIEVDLTRIHDSPDLGRVAAVALLSAMPLDEARLAIEEWYAVLDTREVWRGSDAAAEDIPLDLGHEGGRLQEKFDADRAHPELSGVEPLFRDGDWVVDPTDGKIGMVNGPQEFDEQGQAFVQVKFGPDGPFSYYGIQRLRPATEDEIAVKTGERVSAKPKSHPKGTRLEDCLSAKTAGALKRAGFQVLGDLESRSGEWLLHTVDRFGKRGLAEVEAAMASAGLMLSGKPGVPQRKALPGTPADREISHAIQAGSTPATPPFLKPADEISQSEERAGPPTPAVKQSDFLSEQPGDVIATPNGQDIVVPDNGAANQDARYAKLVGDEEPRETLRELCRRAEGELGRERTWAILQACGVDKISSASPDQETAVRKGVELALGA